MLNQNIAALRKQNGYTQETFAQELNVVRQTVSKWEKGYSVPDALMLERMAELFDVSVGELLGAPREPAGEKPDLKQITEQLSILNNQFAKELARKRRNRKIALAVLAVFLVFAVAAGLLCFVALDRQTYEVDAATNRVVACRLPQALDDAVSKAILSAHAAETDSGECASESHFALDLKEKDGTVTVWLLEDWCRFGFHNGFFTDVSGSFTPVVLTFQSAGDSYRLLARETAQDGADYAPSVKRLFSARDAKTILRGFPEEVTGQLWQSHVQQAKAYLASINRTAVVCAYGDLMIELLSDYGVPTETEDKICNMKTAYDLTVGNHETLENGTRYVYQTDYDAQNDWITFTKFLYETNEVTEFLAVDAATGQVVKDAQQPMKANYYRGVLAAGADG